jgi:L-threonylcarbamoyladenylate synthase
MITELVSVDPNSPEPARIARCAAVLLRGGLVAFPTETVYGLGALADDEAAAMKIYAAKGRPSHNPLISHVASARAARELAPVWSELADELAEQFWPGPLTLVVPRAQKIPRSVCGGLDAMAIRVPAHPVALALLRAVGRPVAAPSANRSNELSPTTAAHVLRGLDGRIDTVLDGGACRVGLESTVVDLCGDVPVILRPGTITIDQVRAIVPTVRMRAESVAHGQLRASPGMDAKHYAPRARLVLSPRDGLRAQITESSGLIGVLTVGPVDIPSRDGVIVSALSDEASAYSAALYERLHWLDEQGCTLIVCERVPESSEWDAARDRLRRAAS